MNESNNDWHPGLPVKTAEDLAAWRAWRKVQVLAGQRDRRAKRRRIDFYPTDKAAKIIDAHASDMGWCYASVISLIIEEWAANSGT